MSFPVPEYLPIPDEEYRKPWIISQADKIIMTILAMSIKFTQCARSRISRMDDELIRNTIL